MFCIPNQSSIPKAYTQYTDEGRLLESGNRDRLVDCMEEFVKYTVVMREHFELFGDRYSEREERRRKREKEEEGEKEKMRMKEVDVEGEKEVSEVEGVEGVNKVNGVDVGSI